MSAVPVCLCVCDPDDPCTCRPDPPKAPRLYKVRYAQRYVSQVLDLMWPSKTTSSGDSA